MNPLKLIVMLVLATSVAHAQGNLTPPTVYGTTAGGGLVKGGTLQIPTFGIRRDCSTNFVVSWDGAAWICSDPATLSTTISGTLTPGRLPIATAPHTLGDSDVYDNTTTHVVTIGGTGAGSVAATTCVSNNSVSGCQFTIGAQNASFVLVQPAGNAGLAIERPTSDAAGPKLTFVKDRNTDATVQTVVVNGDQLGLIQFAGTDGTSYLINGQVIALVDGAVTAGSIPTALSFRIGSNGTPVEALHISSAGVVTDYFSTSLNATSGTTTINGGTTFNGLYSPTNSLVVNKGTATTSGAVFGGTADNSYFMHSSNENTYIRGGKAASFVSIGDATNTGGVFIGSSTNDTSVQGKLNVASLTSINSETVITAGYPGFLSNANGLHFGFSASVGLISATQPGTANRELDVDGSSLKLNVNSVGPTTVGGSLTVNGSFTLGDASGDGGLINAGLVRFNATGDDPYFNANTLNASYSVNANSTLYLNYYGYLGGTTQWRDTYVGNGKNGRVCLFTGATGILECSGMTIGGVNVDIGTGTAGVMPVWTTNAGGLGNSDVYDNTGTHVVTIGGTGAGSVAASAAVTGDSAAAVPTFSAVTTSPVLTVLHTANAGGFTIERATNAATGANLWLLKTRSTDGTLVAIQNGDAVGGVRFAAPDSGNVEREVGRIQLVVNGTVGSNSIPTDMTFNTENPSGSVLEALRLKSDQTAQFSFASTNTTFANAFDGMVLKNTSNTTNNYYEMSFVDNTGAVATELSAKYTDQTNHYGWFQFGTRGAGGFAERMRISDTGLVSAFYDFAVSGNTTLGSANSNQTIAWGFLRTQYDASHYIDIIPKSNNDINIQTAGNTGSIYFGNYGGSGFTVISGTTGNLAVNSTTQSQFQNTGGLLVSGVVVFQAAGSFGGALNMNSNKITSCANGTVSSDVACFGQIQSGISADFTGTTNYLPKRTGTTTYADSGVSDDGVTFLLAHNATLTTFYNTTTAIQGFAVNPYAGDGNVYVDTKESSGGRLIFRNGAGASTAAANTWLTLTAAGVATEWNGPATLDSTVDIKGDATAEGFVAISGGNKLYLNGNADVNWYLYKDTSHNINIGGASIASGTRAFRILDTTSSNALRFNVDLSSGVTTMAGQGLGVGGLHQGAAIDTADVFYSGIIRKNLIPYTDEIGNSLDTQAGGGTDAGFFAVNYNAGAITFATSTAVPAASSPSTVTPLGGTVGKLSCSAASCGDWRATETSTTTGITDTRSKTFTYSISMRAATSNTTVSIGVARYGDSELTIASCSVVTTKMTRCWVTKTFGSTSLTNNSQISVYNGLGTGLVSGNDIYVSDAQLEASSVPTPYEPNDSTVASGANSTPSLSLGSPSYSLGSPTPTANGDTLPGIWGYSLGVGETVQHPNAIITAGGSVAANGSVFAVGGISSLTSLNATSSGGPAPTSSITVAGTGTFYNPAKTFTVSSSLPKITGTGSDNAVVYITDSGTTHDTTAAAHTQVSLDVVASSTRNTGSFAVTNVAGRFVSSGAQNNYALSLTGGIQANSTTGSTGDVLTIVSGVPKWNTPGTGGVGNVTTGSGGLAGRVTVWTSSTDVTGYVGFTSDSSGDIGTANITAAGNILLTQAGDTYFYDSLASSSGNQNLNIDAAGTGTIRFNSNTGGIASAGTGGLALYAGANSSTIKWSVDNAGNQTGQGTLHIVGATTLDANLTATGGTVTVGAFKTSKITPSALAAGNTNNYAPTGFSTATIVDVDGDSGGTSIITGLAGGSDGLEVTFVNNSTSATAKVCFTNEDTNSTTTNRFNLPASNKWCIYPGAYWALTNGVESITFRYDGAIGSGGRWVMKNIASADMSNLEVTGTSFLDGAVTVAANITQTTGTLFINGSGGISLGLATDDYIYTSLAGSSGNQNLNLYSAGTGKIRFNSTTGGTTNAGTGGLELYAGNNGSTTVWTESSAGNQVNSGTLTALGATVQWGDGTHTTHIVDLDGGQRPTVGGCGTSPTVVGDDNSGYLITGTSATATCTITFHTAMSKGTCLIDQPSGTTKVTYTNPPLTTTVAITNASVGTSGVKYVWDCHDH